MVRDDEGGISDLLDNHCLFSFLFGVRVVVRGVRLRAGASDPVVTRPVKNFAAMRLIVQKLLPCPGKTRRQDASAGRKLPHQLLLVPGWLFSRWTLFSRPRPSDALS